MLWVIFIILSFGLTYFLSYNLAPQKRMALLASVPLAALGIYLIVGAPELESRPQAALLESHRFNPHALTAIIENKLSQEPNDYDGWQTLASIHLSLGNFYQAEESYVRADKLKPNQVATLLGWAQTKYFGAQEFVSEDTRALIQRVSKLDRNNLVAIFLFAKALAQEGKINKAKIQLRRARALARAQKNDGFQALVQETLDKIKK